MATYPSEIWPAEAAVRELDGSMDLSTGLPYIAKGTGPLSSPSYEVQYNRREQRLNRIVAAWRSGMVVDEGGLKIGVYPIRFTIDGQRREFSGATGISVPDDVARVVYLDSEGALQIESAFPLNPASFLPLASIQTAGGTLAIVDRRVEAAFHVPSLEASTAHERRIVTAHRAAVGADESDTVVFAFEPERELRLEAVQVFCSAAATAASVEVRQAGESLLAAAAIPLGGQIVKPSVARHEINAEDPVTIHVTTDSGGNISNLSVTLVQTGMAGPY